MVYFPNFTSKYSFSSCFLLKLQCIYFVLLLLKQKPIYSTVWIQNSSIELPSSLDFSIKLYHPKKMQFFGSEAWWIMLYMQVLLSIRVVGFISLFYTGPPNSLLDYLVLQLSKHCCVKTYWHLTIKLRTMCNSPFNNFFFLKGQFYDPCRWPWVVNGYGYRRQAEFRIVL